MTAAIHRKLKRRNAVEPVIGHMKSDGRLARNFLKGVEGDAVNALLCGAGHNLRKILKKLRLFCAQWGHHDRAALARNELVQRPIDTPDFLKSEFLRDDYINGVSREEVGAVKWVILTAEARAAALDAEDNHYSDWMDALKVKYPESEFVQNLPNRRRNPPAS